MRRGFMDFVATRIIPDHPGETAEYYAREYLEIAGKDGSDAKNPIQSLANTLSKRVGTGGEKRVRRERIGGIYRYFPAMPSSAGVEPHLKDIAIQISLCPEELEILDNFVAVGKFTTRGHVLTWLAREGIRARHADIEKVESIIKQIDELKGSAPQL
jgi:hypothetical protein